jgi:Arylsulfotransferase (ASST)
MKPVEQPGLTRGQFLRAAGGAAAGVLCLGPEAAGAAVQRAGGRHRSSALYHTFQSRPDLHPPRAVVRRRTQAAERGDGYWFLTAGTSAKAQNGLVILDRHGNPVWFKALPRGWFAMDFRTQRYRGKPVLTWWQGTIFGRGEGVIMDTSYREVARVQAGNGHQVDAHEFLLTPEGTALITCSASTVPADLSSVGGSRHGQVAESVMQEVDVQTGDVLLEWRSLDHVPVSESYMWAGGGVYDYMHLNSIDVMADGNLLLSARHTWALYKLERTTGEVMWRLGGKRSDFAMGPGTQFAWQHDARQLDERTITVFDDGAAFFEGNHRYRATHRQSRGMSLRVEHSARKVKLSRTYQHQPALVAGGYGNMQTLADGDVVVGWGNLPVASQFAASGAILEDVNLASIYASYRAFRLPWEATPARPPSIATRRSGQSTIVYASWNGTTECTAWAIRAGADPSKLRRVASKRRTGFETAIGIPRTTGYVQATALDGAGGVLASTAAVKL